VKWSRQGNTVFFFEYSAAGVYDNVFLNLKEEFVYRIPEKSNQDLLIHTASIKDWNFDEEEVFATWHNRGYFRTAPYIDPTAQTGLQRILRPLRWYP
jgi:hypothetical protein